MLFSSVEEVQRSEGQSGEGAEGKGSREPVSRAKNSRERLSLSVGLSPSVTHLESVN